MKLIHYTNNSELKLNSICYLQERYNRAFKPTGFWFSIEEIEGVVEGVDDTNWHDWCIEEEFKLENLAHAYEIKLKPEANILYLKSVADILTFSMNYAIELFEGANSIQKINITAINWPSITKRYDGIFVAPYQWSCRFEPKCFWYYSWDCSSGCIWNLDVIDEVIKLPVAVFTA